MSPSTYADWSSLPELILDSIVGHLPSVLDLLAFAAVCRPWRRHLRSSAAASVLPSFPPLLLLPSSSSSRLLPFSSGLSFPSPLSVPDYHRHLCLSFRSPLSIPDHHHHHFLGYSHGHLILLHPSPNPNHHRVILLADVLTGDETYLPPLPPDRFSYYYATLTAPISSSSSLLLLFYSKHAFLSCSFSSPNSNWTYHRLPRINSFVSRVIPFQGCRIFGLTDQAHLLEFHLNPNKTSISSVELVADSAPHPVGDFERCHFGPQLVAAGDRLLLLLFLLQPQSAVFPGPRGVRKISVHSFEFKKKSWEEVDRLDEYSLFVDCGGKSVVACQDVESWGGRGNFVYVAGPGCQLWMPFPLNEEVIDAHVLSRALRAHLLAGARWPSPIWVYPSLLY